MLINNGRYERNESKRKEKKQIVCEKKSLVTVNDEGLIAKTVKTITVKPPCQKTLSLVEDAL